MDIHKITDGQKEALRFALEQRLYKLDFFEFVKKACTVIEPETKFSFNWHIEYLCKRAQRIIEDVAAGVPKEKDVIINVPPRSMKSLIFSVFLNAWAWTRYPHLKFMTISYSDVLSSKFSYKTRLLIKSEWYQKYFGDVFTLSDDDNRKTAYTNNKSGGRESFGSTGSVTGSGADIILCDDLNKPNEVSDTKLDNVISVYRDTIHNRLNSPTVGYRIIICQRTHERDITGHLLASDADSYEHICLPAQLSKDVKPAELAQFYVNGLLWTDRFSLNVLHQYDKNTFMYASQYLQNPMSLENGIIKKNWFLIKNINDFNDNEKQEILNLKYDAFIDSAYTANKENDETGIIIAAKWQNFLIIKKSYVLYLEFPELIRKLRDIYLVDLNSKGLLRVEAKANGLSIIQTLKREGFNVTQTPTPKDAKITRVTSILNYIEAQRVILLRGGNEDALIQQACAFPNSSKDGLVDCLYYAVNYFLKTGAGTMKYKMA